MMSTHREAINSIDEIGNKTKAPGLRSVAKHRQGLPLQGLANQGRHNTPVFEPHPRSVRIKNAHDLRIEPVTAMVRHRDCFRKTLRFVVNTAWPDRIDISPITLFLRMF